MTASLVLRVLLVLTVPALLVTIAFTLLAALGRRWPRTEGTVLQSSIDVRNVDVTPYTYVARVYYQYSVAGQSHLGSRISFGYEAGDQPQEAAQSLADQFPEGALVPVYYLPSRPSVSVLHPTVPRALLGSLASLAAFCGLLIFMIVRGVT